MGPGPETQTLKIFAMTNVPNSLLVHFLTILQELFTISAGVFWTVILINRTGLYVSAQVNFIIKKYNYILIVVTQQMIPHASEAIYLSTNLNAISITSFDLWHSIYGLLMHNVNSEMKISIANRDCLWSTIKYKDLCANSKKYFKNMKMSK